MNPFRLLVTAGLCVLPALVGAMELSGSVLGADRKPLAGVQVRLVGGNAVASTDAMGQWSIKTLSIGPREVRRMDAPRAIVVVENGRLRLRVAGRDLAGRGGGEYRFPVGAILAAGRVQSVLDTLTYSLGGKILLRDTVSEPRTGIVRILDSTFNPAIVYGYLTDSRDGQIYRTVKIGTQTWMAENLNYRNTNGSTDMVGVCYYNSPDSCRKYPRQYTWASLMDLPVACDTIVCASHVEPLHRGVCPGGWHVPDDGEWNILIAAAGGIDSAGTILKSSSGWYVVTNTLGNGTDGFGFRALPDRKYRRTSYPRSPLIDELVGGWWSATEGNETSAGGRRIHDYRVDVERTSSFKTDWNSGRCLEDHPDASTPLAKPVFNLASGVYSSGQIVLITATSGADIHYTTNGTTPTTSSARYTGAISVSKTTTIKALAVKSGRANSSVASATYTISGGSASIGSGMKLIPAGTFTMGSPVTEANRNSNEAQRRVTLSAFWMDSVLVTQGQYEALMGVNPSSFTGRGATSPVENVTWFDAVLYCNVRSKVAGLDTVYSYTSMANNNGNEVTELGGIRSDLSKNGYRLPTEAQWEYAARGGTTTAYYWGDGASADTVSKYAWYYMNSDSSPNPVGTKPANPFGLYDMAGNVSEWVNDWYDYGDTDTTAEQTDPEGPLYGMDRVLRGGCWGDYASSLRSASRGIINPDSRNDYVGFRTVRPGP